MAEKEERKLSKAEKERKSVFEVLRARLEEEGYQTIELTMGTLMANVLSLVSATPFIAGLMAMFFCFNKEVSWERSGDVQKAWSFLLVFMILIVVHELIHGLTWGMFAESKWKAISFGFIWQYLTPYCTCKEPLKKQQMVWGCLMPTIVLGILPSVVAIITGNVVVLYMGCLMILGGGADLIIAGRILFQKSKGRDALYYDHPYKVGTMVFEKKS